MATHAKPTVLLSWRWVLALLVIPFIFWVLAAYLSADVYEAQKNAVKAIATVEGIATQSRVSRVDPQGRQLEYEDRQQVKIGLEIDGELRHSTLLDSTFDPDSSWLQYAEFGRFEYPIGSRLDVLVRRDLGHAVTNASVTASYYLPILIASFGCAIFAVIGLAALVIVLGKRSRPNPAMLC